MITVCNSSHEMYDPVPLTLLSREDQAKTIDSRWAIGYKHPVLTLYEWGKALTDGISITF